MDKNNVIDFSVARKKIENEKENEDFSFMMDDTTRLALGDVIKTLRKFGVMEMNKKSSEIELRKLTLIHLLMRAMYINNHGYKSNIDDAFDEFYNKLCKDKP